MFEHTYVQVYGSHRDPREKSVYPHIIRVADEKAKEGWELVSICQTTHPNIEIIMTAFFKRKLKK